jgi:hypothetical protein
MARIIDFHKPDGFKPQIKWLSEQERGRLIVFPDDLKESARDESALDTEMTYEMSQFSIL